MKKYLILTFDICNMGGGQLFVMRRANHLKKKGYDVHIVVTYHSTYFPLEEKFSPHTFYVIPEMGMTSSKYSKNKVDKIVNDLLEKVGDSQELLIESHTLSTVEWGEIIAEKCRGKHLAYLIAEPKVSKYHFNPGKMIFEYKLRKGEFYGCSSVALGEIFERENLPKHYINIGYDENEMYDECHPLLNYKKDDNSYVITTVTRLEKGYVEPLIKNVILLAKKYPTQKFVLIIAGGSKAPGVEEFFHSNYNNAKLQVNNLNLVYTGYIDKLGKDIFNMSDIFVGMGTAVINSISQRCITLNIDPRDNMQYTSGFFGTDTTNFAYSENGKFFEIVEKLEEAFLMPPEKKDKLIEAGRSLYETDFEMNSCFDKLDKIVNNLPTCKESSVPRTSSLYRKYVNFVLFLHDLLY